MTRPGDVIHLAEPVEVDWGEFLYSGQLQDDGWLRGRSTWGRVWLVSGERKPGPFPHQAAVLVHDPARAGERPPPAAGGQSPNRYVRKPNRSDHTGANL